MSHYKWVNGEKLLCWGRAGDTYKRYMDSYFMQETDQWFVVLGSAAEGSWESEYPVKIQEVTYVKDYGSDKVIDIVDVAEVMCDDNYNITVKKLGDSLTCLK